MFNGESDRCIRGPQKGKPIYEALLTLLRELEPMIGGGLITLERAQGILYRPPEPPNSEPQPDPSRQKIIASKASSDADSMSAPNRGVSARILFGGGLE